MKNLIVILFLSLFATVANAQLNNIIKLPLEDTVVAAATYLPIIDSTSGNKRPEKILIAQVVRQGSVGNFKTVADSSILGTGNVPLEDSLYSVTTAANDSLVVPNAANVVHFNIAGTPGTQTTLALVLPGTSHMTGELDVYFSDVVTTLAITATGGTTVYSPTAIVAAAAGDVISFKKIGTVWFRKP